MQDKGKMNSQQTVGSRDNDQKFKNGVVRLTKVLGVLLGTITHPLQALQEKSKEYSHNWHPTFQFYSTFKNFSSATDIC